ncbi:ABC transporter ATP-binding protein [[Clostridium] polysaccharolyticum]|uniref:Tungstate transport system ATP-binding protein n=1 Tax=[Clostridium] polysaccharolyticum TaxID=29364 RepID=A0A1I0EDD0_9FIRM|nr:ABC transporter ATP-binding protein [[Clostridium] polysaccharolyticum]SET43194.1 tungstate transport system ATP-binding protein [[Clostridium] polysaccharolyticum]
MTSGILEWKHLKKSFQGKTVLDVEHVVLQKGKRYVIIGENGAGKSTLLKILAGVMKTEGKEKQKRPDCKILYMPQKPYIFNMSVMDNMKRTAKKKNVEEFERILEQLDIKELKNNQANSMSGGEKQRLAFGRILAQSCELLLLDEPASAMDVKGTLLFEQVLKEYQKEQGCTLVMVTHDIEQAKRIADQIIFIKEGKLGIGEDYKEHFSDIDEIFFYI